jgi:hypothetical protein
MTNFFWIFVRICRRAKLWRPLAQLFINFECYLPLIKGCAQRVAKLRRLIFKSDAREATKLALRIKVARRFRKKKNRQRPLVHLSKLSGLRYRRNLMSRFPLL